MIRRHATAWRDAAQGLNSLLHRFAITRADAQDALAHRLQPSLRDYREAGAAHGFGRLARSDQQHFIALAIRTARIAFYIEARATIATRVAARALRVAARAATRVAARTIIVIAFVIITIFVPITAGVAATAIRFLAITVAITFTFTLPILATFAFLPLFPLFAQIAQIALLPGLARFSGLAVAGRSRLYPAAAAQGQQGTQQPGLKGSLHEAHSTKTIRMGEYSRTPVRCDCVHMKDAGFPQQLIELIPRLRRFARGLTGSAADADDLAQAALERALVHQAAWQRGTRLDSWLYRIAQNLWRDELRASRRRSEPLDAEALVGEDGRESLLRQVEVRDVSRAFERLPEEQRVILALVVLDGMSYQQAADVLGVPIGTVMSRLARARGRLAADVGGAGKLRAAT